MDGWERHVHKGGHDDTLSGSGTNIDRTKQTGQEKKNCNFGLLSTVPSSGFLARVPVAGLKL